MKIISPVITRAIGKSDAELQEAISLAEAVVESNEFLTEVLEVYSSHHFQCAVAFVQKYVGQYEETQSGSLHGYRYLRYFSYSLGAGVEIRMNARHIEYARLLTNETGQRIRATVGEQKV